MQNDNPFENNSKANSFEAALKSLEATTFSLSEVLNNTSDNIRLLEKSLVASTTNYPYKKKIFTESTSVLRSPEERHWKDTILDIESYLTEIWWFISWEPDDISKTFRLFLISEEKEICWSRFFKKEIEFNSSITFQKPLIECKLEVRLRFSQYIIPFMNSLDEKLKEYKLSLNNKLPF